MPDPQSPDDLATEFNALMRRSGVTVPADRLPAALAGYADLLTQIALLRGRYSHVAEPANVFRLQPMERA